MSQSQRLTRYFSGLFSAIGSYGCSATATPEFRAPLDLIQHMDRLGVTHALVRQNAFNVHPASGNQRLVDDLTSCQDDRVRLFPALTVAPTQYWDRGGVAALRKNMLDSGTRALWVYPGAARNRLQQLEPVLKELIDLKPFLLVDIPELGNSSDVIELAETFPTLPIILTQGMWPTLPTVFDLMRRLPNVLMETSWCHTQGTIADAVREFGVHRVIFGLGPKAHQGAAIAGLAHAQIDEQVKNQIAYGNLARLMGLPDVIEPRTSLTEPAHRVGSDHAQLWHNFILAKPSTVNIIDSHGHLGGGAAWAIHENRIDAQIRHLLPRMDQLGIESMIISGLDAIFSDPVEHNLLLAEKLKAYSPRLRVYFVFNPNYGNQLTPLFESCFAQKVFAGFKLHNDVWQLPITDTRFTPVWEYANAHRLPILLHTWDTPWSSPVQLEAIAPRYPHAHFLLGHSGGGNVGREQAVKLASANTNVYLEWCGSFCSSTTWEETLPRVNLKQVIFGTDGVAHDLSWELGRLLSLNVPDATLQPILGDNMRAILAQRRTS